MVDPIGLCQSCCYAAAITMASASTFYRCGLSETDPRFRKYPSLPVIECAGYQPKTPQRGYSKNNRAMLQIANRR